MIAKSSRRAEQIRSKIAAARVDGTYDRLSARLELPMLLLSVVFVAVLVWPVLDDDLSPLTMEIIYVLDTLIWLAFVVEYTLRLLVSPNRWLYVKLHIPELVVILFPPVRPLAGLAALRLLRLVSLVGMAGRMARSGLLYRTGAYVAWLAAAVLFAGAVAVYDAEHKSPEANIRSFGDAIWWAMTTITTVGYGDHFPVTLEGRIVAAVLMLAGVAAVGAVTASIAAFLVRSVSRAGLTMGEELVKAERKMASDVAVVERELDEVGRDVRGVALVLESVRDITNRLERLERVMDEVAARSGYVSTRAATDMPARQGEVSSVAGIDGGGPAS